MPVYLFEKINYFLKWYILSFQSHYLDDNIKNNQNKDNLRIANHPLGAVKFFKINWNII